MKLMCLGAIPWFVQQVAVGGNGVVKRGRKDMFGREAVLE